MTEMSMTEGVPIVASDAFKEYCHKLLDLQFAIQECDEAKADAVADTMELPGWNMQGLEHDASVLLSGDLGDMEEVLRGTRTLKEHVAVRLRQKKDEAKDKTLFHNQ